MHRTTTGRLAGDFQQLPRQLESGHPILLKYNNRIRSFFVARPGKIFIDSDYESLEPHIFSHLAGDEVLLNIFRTGVDFYSQVAIATEGLTEYSADKSAPNYLGKVNKTARQMAKSYSLGIRYGLDDYKLHKDLGISQQSAQRLVKQYFESFPKLAKSMEDAKNSILNTGRVSNMFGRVRRNPEIPPLYRKYGNSILNALDLWKKFNETPGLYKQAKVDYKTVRAGINNAYNFEVQSTAAHIVNRASIEIAKAFNELGLDAAIIGQCHDEVLIECDESIKEQVAAIMQDKMENTVKLSIDLPAIPQYGYRYSEVK
jgi:DNA polymerase-1